MVYLEALSVLVFLSSGYLAYVLFSRFAPYPRSLKEFEANIYSIILSSIIWSISLFLGLNITPNFETMVTPLNMSVIFGITILISILLIAGVKIIRWKRGIKIIANDAWNEFFKSISTSNVPFITVQTTDGENIGGQLELSGNENQNKEITIKNPVKLIYDKKGNLLDSRDLGQKMLFTSQSVKSVIWKRTEKA